MNELSNTKELILDVFIEMTSALGYENVSMRGIAEKVGIKAASIYNYFESKGKILEHVYDYYLEHQYDNRKPVPEMHTLIETAGARDIVTTFFYTFQTEDQRKYRRMILTTKIVYMRLFQDPIANKIFTDANINNAEYVQAVLQHGINIGRIDPTFDLPTFAEILIGSLQIMGIKAFASVAYQVGQLDQEQRILDLLARLLSTALNPSA